MTTIANPMEPMCGVFLQITIKKSILSHVSALLRTSPIDQFVYTALKKRIDRLLIAENSIIHRCTLNKQIITLGLRLQVRG